MANMFIDSFSLNTPQLLDSFKQTGQEWIGRVWNHIERIPYYMQDKRVACVSLVGATIMAFAIGMIAVKVFQFIFPVPVQGPETKNYTEPFDRVELINLASALIGIGTMLGSLHFFVNRARLPLRSEAVLAIALPILMTMGYIYNKNSGAQE